MEAERKPRITTEGRTPLQDVIPLDTPYLVFLDPSSKCNAKCPWCPTGRGDAKKYYTPGLMDWNLYKKIINDLCRMPMPVKTLRLYADGESLLHPQFPEMVQYAKSTGRFGQIDTTSNAILLTTRLSLSLIAAGLDKIFISVPRGYSSSYIRKIKNFYFHSRGKCEVYVKIIGDWMLPKNREAFMADFGNISDRIFIENQINCWPNFKSGDDPGVGIYGNPLTNVRVCPYITYSLKINSDGTVSICFLDWSRKMIIGDLRTDSFIDVWKGNLLRKHQIMHLKGLRYTHPICRNCKQLTHGMPDDLDQYAQDILRRMP